MGSDYHRPQDGWQKTIKLYFVPSPGFEPGTPAPKAGMISVSPRGPYLSGSKLSYQNN